ncbi:hypothetical protein CBL_00058 [Carabus blaptoides fortunei]
MSGPFSGIGRTKYEHWDQPVENWSVPTQNSDNFHRFRAGFQQALSQKRLYPIRKSGHLLLRGRNRHHGDDDDDPPLSGVLTECLLPTGLWTAITSGFYMVLMDHHIAPMLKMK